jgi:hypothetical protein
MTLDTYYANVWDVRQRDPLQGDFPETAKLKTNIQQRLTQTK